MAVITGFLRNAEIPRVDGHGKRVGMPMVDAANEQAQMIYAPVFDMTMNGRTDGKPILCALQYSPENGWTQKEVYLGDPGLWLHGIKWNNTTDTQVIVAEYEGQAMYLAVKIGETSLPT